MNEVRQTIPVGDGPFLRFTKHINAIHAAYTPTDIVNFPDALSQALHDGSPDIEINKVFAMLNRMIVGDPGNGTLLRNGKYCSVNELVGHLLKGTRESFTLILDDLETAVVISKNESGEFKTKLESFFELDSEVRRVAEKIGISVRQPEHLTQEDIINPIISKDHNQFLSALGDIDNLLTGKRFNYFLNDKYLGFVDTVSEERFIELKEQIDEFFKRAHDINPYCTFTFKLGDKNSKLKIKIDSNRNKQTFSFELITKNQKTQSKFNCLQQRLFLPNAL